MMFVPVTVESEISYFTKYFLALNLKDQAG